MQVTGGGTGARGGGSPGSPCPWCILVPRHTQVCVHARLNYSLSIVPRGPGKRTHTHTHPSDQSAPSQSKDRHTEKCVEAEGDHMQSDTHLVRHNHAHTQGHWDRARDTKTADERGCRQAAGASTCRNTKTGLCLGTRAPLTPPAHRHSHMLKQACTRSPSCAAPLRATRPPRASCRSQAEAPAALEPSWCQHCHHVATGAQCTGHKAGMLDSGDETGEL